MFLPTTVDGSVGGLGGGLGDESGNKPDDDRYTVVRPYYGMHSASRR